MFPKTQLDQVKKEIKQEVLEGILPFWEGLQDPEYGGFYGYVSHDGKTDVQADKGAILHSRILWTFASAYRLFRRPNYLSVANHTYNYLMERFWDDQFGGLYWQVDHQGNVVERRKHIYNQAFGIYGLSEYARSTGHEASLNHAIQLYKLVERHGYDPHHGGYWETFTRDWEEDYSDAFHEIAATDKSMNTHLHILEAYTNLYRVWPDAALRERLVRLIELLVEKILKPETAQFHLFFDRAWKAQSDDISYGHDIEGSWLLDEAAHVVGDALLIRRLQKITSQMAQQVVREGVDHDGGVFNELHHHYVIDADKVWWVQAEAMVGFYNAYQNTRNSIFLDASLNSWAFIKNHLIDSKHGEWHWKLNRNRQAYANMPKVEPWKCPYHNSRACFELLRRMPTDL